MSFQSLLEKKLADIDHNNHFLDKFHSIKQYCVSHLPKIKENFNNYTDHGINHSLKVSEFLFIILERINWNLNPLSIFLLLSGAWTHDLGMIKENSEDVALEEIREEHHKRSKEIIEREYKNWDLTISEAEALGILALSHRSSKSFDIGSITEKFVIDNEIVNLPFLCACLRVADECHITYDRAEEMVNSIGKLDAVSKEHILSHYQTRGIAFSERSEILLIRVKINSILVDNFMSSYIQKLTYEIDVISAILNGGGLPLISARLMAEKTESYELEKSGKYQEILLWIISNQMPKYQVPVNIPEYSKNIITSFLEIIKIKNESLLQISESTKEVQLNINDENFDFLSDLFLNSKYRYSFLESDYCQEYLRVNLHNFLNNNWNIDLDDKKTIKSIQIINQTFPNALLYSISPPPSILAIREGIQVTDISKLSERRKKAFLDDNFKFYFTGLLEALISDLYDINNNPIAKTHGLHGHSVMLHLRISTFNKLFLEARSSKALFFEKYSGEAPLKAGTSLKFINPEGYIHHSAFLQSVGLWNEALETLESVKHISELSSLYVIQKAALLLKQEVEFKGSYLFVMNEIEKIDLLLDEVENELYEELKKQDGKLEAKLNYFWIKLRKKSYSQAFKIITELNESNPDHERISQIVSTHSKVFDKFKDN